MKRSFPAVILLLEACLCRGEVIRFDNAIVGTVPAGWTVAMTHTGGAPSWEIRSDDSAPSGPNVLAQVSADRTAGRFPLDHSERGLSRQPFYGELRWAKAIRRGRLDV